MPRWLARSTKPTRGTTVPSSTLTQYGNDADESQGLRTYTLWWRWGPLPALRQLRACPKVVNMPESYIHDWPDL